MTIELTREEAIAVYAALQSMINNPGTSWHVAKNAQNKVWASIVDAELEPK